MQQLKEMMDGVVFAVTIVAYVHMLVFLFRMQLHRWLQFLRIPLIGTCFISGAYAIAKILNFIRS